MFENIFKKLRIRAEPRVSRSAGQIGRDGESAAARHVSGKGWRIVERNWACKIGEVDLICRDAETWIFVEVKTSNTLGAAPPQSRIDAEKRRRLQRLARLYLRNRFDVEPVRFDVISVWWENDEIQIRHIEHAF